MSYCNIVVSKEPGKCLGVSADYIEDLTDLRDINVDTKLPVKEKLRSFAKQSNNLYIHRVGNYVVKVSFQKEGPTINDKMEEYIRRLAEVYI